MANTKDNQLPGAQGWIHDLARAEVHPDAERVLQLGRSSDPQQLVEESTIEFLNELKALFQEYRRVFNAYSEKGSRFQEVKIYAVANTAADFMLFRNSINLLVCNSAHGMIQVQIGQHVRGTLSVDGQALPGTGKGATQAKAFPAVARTIELMAQVGPFRDVSWTFQGEKVNPEQLARFYFAEFSRVTRDVPQGNRGSNQVLLDQIKALLQEKGLDL